MTTVATLWVDLKGNIADFMTKMGSAERQVSTTSANLSAAGGMMTRNATAPLLGIGAASTAMAIDLNSGLANVASLSDEAAASIAAWKPQVQQTAVAVGKGTGDMADGLYNVVSAFGVADDTIQVLDINARAAAAGISTTTDAINLTSAVTKGYGDTSAAAVQHAADLALRTVQLGQTTFPELASSVGRVVPIMASLGGTQEELFAVLATGTGVTGTAAEVSTQLRGVLQSMMAPTTDMTTLISSLGYENGQAMFQSLGLQGSIAAIMEAAESSGLPLQKYIGSIEGQTLAMALNGPQADVFTEKLAAMGDVAGATEAAFAAQTQGINVVGFEAQQARIQMQVWGQQIGDQLLPVIADLLPKLEPIVDTVASLIQRFADADPWVQKTILGVAGLAAAAGPALMVIGSIGSGIGTLMTVASAAAPVIAGLTGSAGALGAVLTFLTGPIGIAIAALVAGGALLFTAWKRDFGGVRTFVQDKLAGVDGDMRNLLPALLDWAENANWAEIGRKMMTGILDFFTDMAQWQVRMVQWVGSLYHNAIIWVANLSWGDVGNAILDGIIWSFRTNMAVKDALIGVASGAWQGLIDWFEIRSPSARAIRDAGYIGQGLVQGIDGARDQVAAAVGRVNRSMTFGPRQLPTFPTFSAELGGANSPPTQPIFRFDNIHIDARGNANGEQLADKFIERVRSRALEGLVMADV